MNQNQKWFKETLHEDLALHVCMERVVVEEQTQFQRLLVFENKQLGVVLALDGVLQTTQKDEFTYHEMLAHVPLLAHGSVAEVLIIGGGDGGVLRECLKHPQVRVTQIDIDAQVIERCQQYLPTISDDAFTHPRTTLKIADGAKYIAETQEKFDLIIVDSTDPGGPSVPLFTREFYAQCKRCMTAGGILVTQSGTPFLQPQEARNSYLGFRSLFADAYFYTTCVPTYIGGHLAIGWATDNPSLRQHPITTLQQRFDTLNLDTYYYTCEIHIASFALPKYFFPLMV